MKKRTLFLFLAIICAICVYGQKVQSNRAFKPGEVMEYDAYYNLGPIWIKLGYAKFTVELDSANHYKYTITAYNLPKWDWVYSLHTVHSATSTLDLQPLTYSAITTENKVHSEVYYLYDKASQYVLRTIISDKIPDGTQRSFPHEPYSQDIVNSIYVARNVDLTPNGGKDIPFYPIYDDKVFPVYGNVLGKETIKTRNDVSYDCIKCVTMPPEGTLFDAKEPVYIWITDDNREIPVLVEAKIMIGRVKVYLSDYKEGGQ